MTTASAPGDAVTFDVSGLSRIFDELLDRGYDIVGPGIRDQVIGLGPLAGTDDLPAGWTDDQSPGRYRLLRRDDEARFGFAVGPTSAKRVLHPPRSPVWTITRSDAGGLDVEMHEPEPHRQAFFGLRPCELAAVGIHDRILGGDDADPVYGSQRHDAFIVVVNCGDPAGTCFCTSMGTGPFADEADGADLVLTELVATDDIRYVATARTATGAEVLRAVSTATTATADELERVEGVRRLAGERIEKTLDTRDLRDRLFDRLDSPRWDAVGERCLSCGNCALVCPTCYCTTPEDTTDLDGSISTRTQVWDTCFTASFSQVGPAPIRTSIGSRYRQWLTHKLASWVDQWGMTGCVGCGRCITWCPVGIDLTAEVDAVLATDVP